MGCSGGPGSGVNMCTAGGQMLPQTIASDHVLGFFLSPDILWIPARKKTKRSVRRHSQGTQKGIEIKKEHKSHSGLVWSGPESGQASCVVGERESATFPALHSHRRGLGEASDTTWLHSFRPQASFFSERPPSPITTAVSTPPLLKFIHNVPGQNRQTIFVHCCGFSETPNQTFEQQMISWCNEGTEKRREERTGEAAMAITRGLHPRRAA